jgi:hypothetical protein
MKSQASQRQKTVVHDILIPWVKQVQWLDNPGKINECQGKGMNALQSETITLWASRHFPRITIQSPLPLYARGGMDRGLGRQNHVGHDSENHATWRDQRVVAEGLESFWTLQKSEGCLRGTGPETAAIEGMGMG